MKGYFSRFFYLLMIRDLNVDAKESLKSSHFLIVINFIHFQAYSSLARNHPDLMGESKIIETAKAHNSTPQV